MDYQSAKAVLYDMMKQINYYENVIMTLSWDMRVNLPVKATEYRGDTIGFLTDKQNQLKRDPRLDEAARTVLDSKEADDLTMAMAKLAHDDYVKYMTIPSELVSGYAALNLKAEMVWQQARKTNDYQLFKPYMQQEFEYKRKFAEAMGQGDDPMSYLMSEWEEGLTVQKMDSLFRELKDFLVPFLRKLQEKGAPGTRENIQGHYPIEIQRKLVHDMLEQVGYDFGAGRVDESAHPYTTANNMNDIRITTRYFENDFTNACISSLHETGHALYRQHLDPRLSGTMIDSSPSMAVDESQSRYLENVIGRSKEFWTWMLPRAQEAFPELKKFDIDTFYRYFSAVRPTASRLESDELTYNLHIIIRYEIEKLLFAGEISYDDVPGLWNDKYEEYLGIRPKNDSEGVLQDMHWASGYIGYFQCYVMGNFYDGHYYSLMKKDIPDMYDQVARGCFENIIKWQTDHVHKYGRLFTPSQLLKNIDGQELQAKYYIDYINEKYSKIYEL